jgi:hypothetical protein
MDRREALRLLATAGALQLAPGRLFAVLREARGLLGTEAGLRTLLPHQNATVTAIAELIIPKTETPGATDAGVSAFIDLILTEWYNDSERARFLSGLADVDARSQALFEKDFVACLPSQQAEILTALGEHMTEDADAVHDVAREYRGAAPQPQANFYYTMRRLTLTGYYTSEAGATEELGFQIIPDRHDGCADARTGKQGPDRQ